VKSPLRPDRETGRQREQPLSLSQLAQRTGTSMGGVHKEVERLERSGLVISKTSGRSRLVEPNRSSPVYTELRSLLTKTMDPNPYSGKHWPG
jgi:predicted transcriptional regulator